MSIQVADRITTALLRLGRQALKNGVRLIAGVQEEMVVLRTRSKHKSPVYHPNEAASSNLQMRQLLNCDKLDGLFEGIVC